VIPPLPIDIYPENTLEGMIASEWVAMICECGDHTINLEPISEAISHSRNLMRDAGWPHTYQHNFLCQLRRDLTELTHGHPVARLFVTMLELETEFN
jgi:hypothetical protein